jgi:hypothetical protein
MPVAVLAEWDHESEFRPIERRAEKLSAFRQSQANAALREVGGMRYAFPPYFSMTNS